VLLNLSTAPRRRAVSLTPLIDVVFILLLFFMLSSSFIQHRQINLPMATASQSDPQLITRVQLLDNLGRILVDGVSIDSENMQELTHLIQRSEGAAFALSAEPQVSTQALIRLLDQLHNAGADKVSLSGVLMP
jgi:biopolymer transport protein ExbD